MTTPQNPQAQPSPEAFAATPFPYGEAIQEAAAAPKKSKRKKVLSLLGTLALIIVLAIVKVAIGEAINGPVHAKVGDCVTVTGSANNPSVDTVAAVTARPRTPCRRSSTTPSTSMSAATDSTRSRSSWTTRSSCSV